MSRSAPARIHVALAFADGTFQFIALHPSLTATSARVAERLAVQAEGGYVQRGQTMRDDDGWSVTLSANAAAARYWGPVASRARNSL
jgi:hypothetical protein